MAGSLLPLPLSSPHFCSTQKRGRRRARSNESPFCVPQQRRNVQQLEESLVSLSFTFHSESTMSTNNVIILLIDLSLLLSVSSFLFCLLRRRTRDAISSLERDSRCGIFPPPPRPPVLFEIYCKFQTPLFDSIVC